MVQYVRPPEPDPCPICGRPNHAPSDHHFIPRSRGGKTTKTICADCHQAVHRTFTNKELEETYHTVDALISHEGFAKLVKFISKQSGRVRTIRNKNRKKGKYK